MEDITHDIHGEKIYMVIEPDSDGVMNDHNGVHTHWDDAVEAARELCEELEGGEVYICEVTLTPVQAFKGTITSRPLKGNK